MDEDRGERMVFTRVRGDSEWKRSSIPIEAGEEQFDRTVNVMIANVRTGSAISVEVIEVEVKRRSEVVRDAAVKELVP